MFAISCGVGFLPAMRSAGSPPGIFTKMKKVRKLTTISTSTMPISRRTMKAATSVSDLDLRARVERVAQAVAEDVEGEHRQEDGDARRERQPGRRADGLGAIGDEVPPGRLGRLHAGAEEREPGLEDDVVGDREGEEHEHG